MVGAVQRPRMPKAETGDTGRAKRRSEIVPKTQITLPLHPALLDALDQHRRDRLESRGVVVTRALLKLLAEEAPQLREGIRRRLEQGGSDDASPD